MRSEDEGVGARAAAQILDRVLGRPTQRSEVSGRLEVQAEMENAADKARAKLEDLVQRRIQNAGDQSDQARAKLGGG